MDIIFLTGLIGSLFLVTGSAWKDPKKNLHPAKARKNQLFAIGNSLLFIYAMLSYFEGGAIFFVFLESLMVVSTIFMLLNVNDRWASAAVALSGLFFLAWSFYLFENSSTVFFILGLTGAGIGFILKDNVKRNLALALGSVLIAVFSYLEGSGVYFWLNLFFAIFSTVHVVKARRRA